MVTLQDLKWIVKQPEKEEKAPTARHLLEHGKRVVSMENGGDVQLLVFLEGWALYRVGKYTTVFSVHGCGSYCYESHGRQIFVDAAFFEETGVVCAPDVRGRGSSDEKPGNQAGKERSFLTMRFPEEWFFLSSPVLPPLEQLIEKEQILELMGLLTKRQRDIVILYFYYGKPSGRLQGPLGISQPAVSQALMAALRRMREGQEEIFSGKEVRSGRCAV